MEWYFGQSGTLERASGSSFGASWRGVLALVGPFWTLLAALGPLLGRSWRALGAPSDLQEGSKGPARGPREVPEGPKGFPRDPQGVQNEA